MVQLWPLPLQLPRLKTKIKVVSLKIGLHHWPTNIMGGRQNILPSIAAAWLCPLIASQLEKKIRKVRKWKLKKRALPSQHAFKEPAIHANMMGPEPRPKPSPISPPIIAASRSAFLFGALNNHASVPTWHNQDEDDKYRIENEAMDKYDIHAENGDTEMQSLNGGNRKTELDEFVVTFHGGSSDKSNNSSNETSAIAMSNLLCFTPERGAHGHGIAQLPKISMRKLRRRPIKHPYQMRKKARHD
mmetsp:Transcript_7328/g.16058  ORF Transcript_7328/g.16058 Transcript_7328/m.16058 type:complete len:244 (-) Transcript_7328:1106-1837(-)